ILTSNSALGGADSIIVAADGGHGDVVDRYLAVVVGTNPDFDVALLEVQSNLNENPTDFVSPSVGLARTPVDLSSPVALVGMDVETASTTSVASDNTVRGLARSTLLVVESAHDVPQCTATTYAGATPSTGIASCSSSGGRSNSLLVLDGRRAA